ncbi:amino acid adenylation domain-containing protein [Streptomyces sp. NPDC001941]|uniref:non-ribosomal peptide synthetase n=1 Tax=Streptomyces sp. NPDC001941 TaxID=3154659 RepID=UPI003320FB81
MTTNTAQLPTDRPRGTSAPKCSATATRTLPAATAGSDALVLAGFAFLLHRFGGQDELVLPVREGAGATRALGFTCTGEETLAELAAAPVPAAIVPEGGAAVCLAGTEGPGEPPSREAELVVHPATPEGRRVELRHDPRLFDPATAELLLRSLHALLDDATASPHCPVSRLRLLSDDDAHRTLVEWNDTATELPHGDALLHQPFEQQAAQRPDALAVIEDGGQSLTYAQVEQRANRFAHHLRASGVDRGARVGLCLERSADLLIAALAVLKAGGAYVPLDPAYPAERLAAMVGGAHCAALVSRTHLTANLPAPTEGTRLVLLDRDAPAVAEQPAHPPARDNDPEDLCYVIYTSGSTGAPKPIALRHRGVLNNLMDLATRYGTGHGDTVLALSSPSFDMSVVEFLGTTATGGTVVVPAPDRVRDPRHWAELAARHGITVWNSAPALLELLMDHLERDGDDGALARLRLVMLGGDWVPLSLPGRVRALTPGLRFIVLGGATEASVHSTVYEVGDVADDWTSIPYGRPMANQRTYVLDHNLQPVPPGVTGELYLAGTGLARGYLDQPERTSERFLRWSHGPVADERLYRTGDLARLGHDGLIELIGRADFQVKIHGLRVELGEIEAALREAEDVKDAVVAAHPDSTGDPRLVGYVVTAPGADVDARALRTRLADKLPAYMVPTAILALPALPLTPNGKVDRKNLPAPDPAGAQDAPATDPADHAPGSWEEHVAAVWSDVLGLPRIGPDDDFFALGGDSMKALRGMMRIHPALKWADMYRKSTLRGLSDHLRQTVAPAPGSAAPGA